MSEWPLDIEAVNLWLEEGAEGTPAWVVEAFVSDLVAEVERLRELTQHVLPSPEVLGRRHGDTGGRLMEPEGREVRGYVRGDGPE